MQRNVIMISAATAIALFAASAASASVTVYVGEDLLPAGTPPAASAEPNSLAAEQAFAATGASSLITFESAPLGSFSTLTLAPGVTVTGTDLSGSAQTIRNTTNFAPDPTVDGFNTTAGGANFVEQFGGTVTFSFAQPIESFGAYLSGVQTAFFPDSVNFSDGTSQTFALVGAGTSGSVGELAFIGFTDPGKSITSVTINAGTSVSGADAIGIDDVRYEATPVAAVPEPASWLMLLVGFAGLGLAMRSRRRLATVEA